MLLAKLRDWLRQEDPEAPSSEERRATNTELREQTRAMDQLIERLKRQHDEEMRGMRR